LTITAQTDEILLEPNVFTHVEITESDLEIDVFFDAEVGQIIQIVSDVNPTNENFNLDRVAIYTPDGDELMTITRFDFSRFDFQPFRVTVGGRYRIHMIADESSQVEVRYTVRETPNFEESSSLQDRLYSMVGSIDFTFTVEAGEIITSYVRTESFDAMLTLYDPNGDIVATDDDSFGQLNPQIDLFTIMNSGTYRLVVDSYNSNGEGQFKIYLNRNPTLVHPHIEYNEPIPVAFEDGAVQYTFHFDGLAGDVVALHFDNPKDIADVRIEYPFANDRMVLINTNESEASLYNQWDRFVLPDNHTYSLYVTPKEKGASGEVTVKIEHLTSHSLEGGTISVHVSEKNPIQRFTFMGYSNSSATITINQDNYNATTMPYRVTVLKPDGSIMNQMTVDSFVGSFSQTNIFGTDRLSNGETTIELEMLGDGPAWFDVSVEVNSGMG